MSRSHPIQRARMRGMAPRDRRACLGVGSESVSPGRGELPVAIHLQRLSFFRGWASQRERRACGGQYRGRVLGVASNSPEEAPPPDSPRDQRRPGVRVQRGAGPASQPWSAAITGVFGRFGCNCPRLSPPEVRIGSWNSRMGVAWSQGNLLQGRNPVARAARDLVAAPLAGSRRDAGKRILDAAADPAIRRGRFARPQGCPGIHFAATPFAPPPGLHGRRRHRVAPGPDSRVDREAAGPPGRPGSGLPGSDPDARGER